MIRAIRIWLRRWRKPHIQRDFYTDGWRVDYPGEFFLIKSHDLKGVRDLMLRREYYEKHRDWGD